MAFSYFSSAVSLDEVKSYTRQPRIRAYPLVQTHLENLGELLLGKLDTGRDGLPDGREDLLDLVLGLNVVDLQTGQRRGCYLYASLTPDLVDEGRAGRVLGVIDAVRPELSTKTRVGPGEVGRVGGLLVLG